MKEKRSGKQREKHSKRKIVPILAVIVFICFGLGALALWEKKNDQATTADLPEEPVIEKMTLEDEGVTYTLREDITTYLILGVDETLDSAHYEKEENLNNKQADFLMLMILDRTRKTYTALHLNRDTMMDIPRLNAYGGADGTVCAHLNNAYSFGSGGRDSCRNTVNAVSALLFDIPIDHYFAITMDGIPVLNDLVGGVPVHIDDDLTAIDPAFTEGADVTLYGQQALSFVRARMNVTGGMNLRRMERQRSYVTALYEQVKKKLNTGTGFALKLAETVDPYSKSDMTTDELSQLVEKLKDYTFLGIEDMKGDIYLNPDTGYYEFLPDQGALKKQVIGLLFERAADK